MAKIESYLEKLLEDQLSSDPLLTEQECNEVKSRLWTNISRTQTPVKGYWFIGLVTLTLASLIVLVLLLTPTFKQPSLEEELDSLIADIYRDTPPEFDLSQLLDTDQLWEIN